MPSKRKLMVGKALSVDPEKMTMTVVISTSTLDRDGDILESRGIKLENYNTNPVVLWAHNRSLPPIAKAIEVLVSDNTVMAHLQFDDEDGFAKMIFNKYRKGILNAWSVGFNASEKDVEGITDKDGILTGFKFNEWELLEFSAVPIPANAEALTRSLKEMDNGHKQIFAKGYDAVEVDKQDSDLLALYKSVMEEDQSNGDTTGSKDEDKEYNTLSVFPEGIMLFSCKTLDNGFIGQTPITKTIKANAFKKSVKERGEEKILNSVRYVDQERIMEKYAIDFEIINENEKEITEAKILCTRIFLPKTFKPATPTPPEEPGRDGEDEEGGVEEPADKNATVGEEKSYPMDDLEMEIADLNVRILNM